MDMLMTRLENNDEMRSAESLETFFKMHNQDQSDFSDLLSPWNSRYVPLINM